MRYQRSHAVQCSQHCVIDRHCLGDVRIPTECSLMWKYSIQFWRLVNLISTGSENVRIKHPSFRHSDSIPCSLWCLRAAIQLGCDCIKYIVCYSLLEEPESSSDRINICRLHNVSQLYVDVLLCYILTFSNVLINGWLLFNGAYTTVAHPIDSLAQYIDMRRVDNNFDGNNKYHTTNHAYFPTAVSRLKSLFQLFLQVLRMVYQH